MAIATLRALHAIIGDSLDQIDNAYSSEDVEFPSLDLPYNATSPGEVLAKTDPVVRKAIEKAVSACGHIAASMQNPFMSLSDVALGYHLPAALRVLEGLPSALPLMTEAGEAGVHVKVIAEREGMYDESSIRRLAHVFRLLATHHILREVSPGDVFALNRISGYMSLPFPDDRNTIVDPLKRYDGTDGTAAYIGLCVDELCKSSAYLLESLLPKGHPFAFTPPPSGKKAASPNSASLAAFNYAFRTRQGYFPWLERVGPTPNISNLEQDYRLIRFSKGMTGSSDFEGPGGIWNALDWKQLPENSVVVDVGGGIGSATMLLAKGLQDTNTKFYIQDRPPQVKLGQTMWKDQCPELLNNGTVCFQIHDFFKPQPLETRAPTVYLLRAVLHDWPDKDAQSLLFRLREAASETTKLVIADHVLPLACVDTYACGGDIEVDGAEQTLAPPPLLPNLAKANSNAYWLDLTMQTTFNSQERTLKEIMDLCNLSGWKVTTVRRSTGSLFGYVIATPLPDFVVPPYVSPPLDSPIESVYERCSTPTFGSITSLPSPRRTRFGFAIANRKQPLVSPNTPPKTPPEQPTSPVTPHHPNSTRTTPRPLRSWTSIPRLSQLALKSPTTPPARPKLHALVSPESLKTRTMKFMQPRAQVALVQEDQVINMNEKETISSLDSQSNLNLDEEFGNGGGLAAAALIHE